jgi:hypothetical protein
LAHSFAEDSATMAYMRSHGLQVRFVSDATIINHEAISVFDLYNFLIRQMLCCRLQSPYHWRQVLIHSLVLNGTVAASMILPLFDSLQRAVLIGSSVLSAVAAVEILVACRLARSSVAKRGVKLPFRTWRQFIGLPLYVLGTNLMGLASTLHAPFVRRIVWRGITYRVGGEPKVSILHVRPMSSAAKPFDGVLDVV